MSIVGVCKFRWMLMCLAFGLAVESRAQESRPMPPLPPPPPVRTAPAVRAVPLRTGVDTNRSVPATVPMPTRPLARLGPANLLAPSPAIVPAPTQITNAGALVYDAEQKEYAAKAGETTASFTFYLTNVSSSEVLVNRVNTSCGCTVAKLPEQPWHVAPGSNGPIQVTVDLRGKHGTLVKSVTVDSTVGVKPLLVKIVVPPPQLIAAVSTNNMDRNRNLERAKADPQAIFKSDCAECHVKPAIGKVGKELYAGACAICHDAEHRATMVPDLHVFKHPNTREYWVQIISVGKLNSLMPGFARNNGGILTEEQIGSLVDYLAGDFTKEANAAPHASGSSLALPVSSPVLQRSPQTNAANTSGAAPGVSLGLSPVKDPQH